MEPPTLIVFDTETTGLSPIDSGIIEIAAVALRGREIVGEFSTLVWPGREKLRPTNRQALKVSGITLEMLMDAPQASDAKAELLRWMDETLARQGDLCATSYNVAFDRPFLDDLILGVQWWPCLMLRAMERMSPAGALILRRDGSWKYPRLSEAASFFGVPCVDSHRALGDARTAARIWIAMEERER